MILAYPIYSVEAITSPDKPIEVNCAVSMDSNPSFISELTRHYQVTDQLYSKIAYLIGHLDRATFVAITPVNPYVMFDFLFDTVTEYLRAKLSHKDYVSYYREIRDYSSTVVKKRGTHERVDFDTYQREIEDTMRDSLVKVTV